MVRVTSPNPRVTPGFSSESTLDASLTLPTILTTLPECLPGRIILIEAVRRPHIGTIVPQRLLTSSIGP